MTCPKHRTYAAKRQPRVSCETCWRMWLAAQDRRAADAYNAALPGRLAQEKADLTKRAYGTPDAPTYPHLETLCCRCKQWPMWDTPRGPQTHRMCLPCWDASADW